MTVVITGIPVDSSRIWLIDLDDRSATVSSVNGPQVLTVTSDQANAIRKCVKEVVIQLLPTVALNQPGHTWPFLAPLRCAAHVDASPIRVSQVVKLRTILRREAADHGISLDELLWTLFRVRDIDLVTSTQLEAFVDWTRNRYYRHEMDLVLEHPDPLPEEAAANA